MKICEKLVEKPKTLQTKAANNSKKWLETNLTKVIVDPKGKTFKVATKG